MESCLGNRTTSGSTVYGHGFHRLLYVLCARGRGTVRRWGERTLDVGTRSRDQLLRGLLGDTHKGSAATRLSYPPGSTLLGHRLLLPRVGVFPPSAVRSIPICRCVPGPAIAHDIR